MPLCEPPCIPCLCGKASVPLLPAETSIFISPQRHGIHGGSRRIANCISGSFKVYNVLASLQLKLFIRVEGMIEFGEEVFERSFQPFVLYADMEFVFGGYI